MATTKKEALEESIKSLTMEYAKKIFENGDHGFDCRDMRGLPIEKELFEEYVNKRKPLLEELYECENPDMCFEDFEDVEEDNINDIEDEDISDEQYDLFDEKMEDVYIDLNNIFSNVDDIEHNINYDFPNKFELKEEIFKMLEEIREKTETLSEKIMDLVYYMK